jgi:hypothetical protein
MHDLLTNGDKTEFKKLFAVAGDFKSASTENVTRGLGGPHHGPMGGPDYSTS